MVHLIRLHNHADDEADRIPILVNPDNISYIRPMENGGCHIIFCCAEASHYQGLYVIESLDEIISLIKVS